MIADFLAIQLMIGNINTPTKNILNSIINISSKKESLKKTISFLKVNIDTTIEDNKTDNSILLSDSEFAECFSSPKFYMITGKNRIGKSSLLSSFAGLFDVNFNENNMNKILKHNQNVENISYHLPDALLIRSSLLDNILLVKSVNKDDIFNCKDGKILKIINQLGGLERVFAWAKENLSSGKKLLVELLRIKFRNCDFYFIDEVSAHLDKENKKLLVDILFEKSLKKTVFYISHDDDEKKYLKEKGAISIILKDKISRI